MLVYEEMLALIRQAKRGDERAKERLLCENVSLIKSIVKRYLNKGVEYDDLFQLASLGFIKAVDGFDEEYGVRFSTYAVPMIAGEIKRFMRDDGSVKVSRSLKQTAKEMNAYVERRTQEDGCQPTVAEVAQAFHMEESEAVFVLGSSRMPVSIYAGADAKDGKERSLLETLPAEDTQDALIEGLLLKGAIEALPERERKIIVLRYFRDMTQSEVAKTIGVSQVQVSRLETKIIKSFREKLSG